MVTVPQLGEELQPVGWGLADSLRVGVQGSLTRQRGRVDLGRGRARGVNPGP